MEAERPDAELQQLLNEARAGSQTAAQELYDNYGPHVLTVVRRHLLPVARRLFDSSDLTQQVWQDFFTKVLREELFSTPQDLVAFLSGMAANKVAMVHRRLFEFQKTNVNREIRLDDFPAGHEPEVPDPHPSAADIAEANDQWEHFIQGEPDHVRQAISGLREGMTVPEIAKAFGLSERTVRRMIHRLSAKISGGGVGIG